jgi:hypothetical protein
VQETCDVGGLIDGTSPIRVDVAADATNTKNTTFASVVIIAACQRGI